MSYNFISYSRADREYARQLAEGLKEEGFDVWIDDRIDYGTVWPDVIQSHLEGCAAFIVIMTSHAYHSAWVQKELTYALELKKPIFPVLLEGNTPWPSIASIQTLSVHGGVLPPPRFYDTLAAFVPRRFALPLLRWCDIPAGRVTVERIVRQVSAFRMSKYPVTNAQYQAFIEHTIGYGEERWWSYSPHAVDWHRRNPKPVPPHFAGDDHPRETVCWYEAVAFCQWLSFKTGLGIQLPDEWQWQRAAQDDDERKYPWGSTFDPGKCNTQESGIGATTPVTQYSEGAGRYEVWDMSGNVWEWCLNEFAAPESINSAREVPRAVRGGSWAFPGQYAQVTSRDDGAPDVRVAYAGFRLTCAIS